MSYRRSLIARTKLFYQQQQRFAPSFSHISSGDREEQPPKSICRNSEIRSQFLRNYATNPLLSGNVTRLMRSEVPVARYGLNFSRNYSNVPLDGVIGVKAAPVVNEVAVAAADSFFPVAAFQHLIDYVHCYTGLEWWASIAATSLLIHVIHLPSFIFSLRVFAFIIPNVSTFIGAIRSKEKAREFFDKLQNQFSNLPLRLFGYFLPYISAPLLFFAILNMVEKVPSFTTGGTLWFTDLTTPDRMYLPILWTLTFWFRFKLDPIRYQQGSKSRYSGMLLQVALIGCGAVAAGFPTAIYCYGITSNLFFIAFGKLLMYPRVRKLLELPALVKKSH